MSHQQPHEAYEHQLDPDTCMCGDPMKGHSSPINCGHSPVSERDYYDSLPKATAGDWGKSLVDPEERKKFVEKIL